MCHNASQTSFSYFNMFYKTPHTIPTATEVTALTKGIIRGSEEDLTVLWQLKPHNVLQKPTCLSCLLGVYLTPTARILWRFLSWINLRSS